MREHSFFIGPESLGASMPEDVPVHRIVLTGGPCGGKSSALALISRRIAVFGYDVYCVPEAATIVLSGGVQIKGMPAHQVAAFQAQLLKVILALEDSFYEIAKATGRPSILFCDRGAMDGSAYVSGETWSAILAANNWTIEHLRDRRYEAVIHLVTAADGAENFYSAATNAVRSESAKRARELDALVYKAWQGHPALHVIDNSTDFAGKIDRVVAAISEAIGLTKNPWCPVSEMR
jgi:predicted ATPase